MIQDRRPTCGFRKRRISFCLETVRGILPKADASALAGSRMPCLRIRPGSVTSIRLAARNQPSSKEISSVKKKGGGRRKMRKSAVARREECSCAGVQERTSAADGVAVTWFDIRGLGIRRGAP
jgi:hypothetical protein